MNRQQQIDHFVSQAHQLAMQRLREQPERLREVQMQLTHWRKVSGTTRSDVDWNQWEPLLHGPMDALAQAVCATSDHAAVLRSVSPMSVLIMQTERAQLFPQPRHGR